MPHGQQGAVAVSMTGVVDHPPFEPQQWLRVALTRHTRLDRAAVNPNMFVSLPKSTIGLTYKTI